MATRSTNSPNTRRDAETNRAFGEVLRRYRLGAELTQEELAARCEMDRAYISAIERGMKEPCLATLLKLSRVLDTSTGDLLREVEQQLRS